MLFRSKALLPKLADLPQEAEIKARTEAEFRREIRELKGKVTAAEKAVQNAAVHAAHTLGAKPAAKVDPNPRMMERAFAALVKNRDVVWLRAVRDFQREMERRVSEAVKQLAGQMHTIPFTVPDAPEIPKSVPSVPSVPSAIADAPIPGHAAGALSRALTASRMRHPITVVDGVVKLGATHTMIAGILAGYYPEPIKISILAALCGLTMGGSFSARLSEVRSTGLLEDPARGYVKATEKCAQEYLGKFQAPSTTAEVYAMWAGKWGKVHRDIMQFLIAQGGEAVSKDALAEAVGMTPGGSFSARLSEVRSSGLLTEPGRGLVAANKEALFLNGDSPRARQA